MLQGRDDWFWNVYQTQYLRLLAYARRLVSRYSRGGDAEDLCHEVWVRFHRSGRSIKTDKLRAWLFKVARNLSIDLCRKMMPELLRDGQDGPSKAPSPDEQAQAGETAQTIRRCLDRLAVSNALAANVIEGHMKGEEPADSAKRLGITRDQVDRVKFDGRALLKRCIESKGGGVA